MPTTLDPAADALPDLLPDLHCACANLRRAARLVTQLYSQEMGELEPAQFALLSAIGSLPGSGQAPLARALGLDKTTLSRNLGLMERKGWLASAQTGDARERGYRLTRTGKRLLAATKPGWARAQARLRAAMQPEEWATTMRTINRAAEAACSAREKPTG